MDKIIGACYLIFGYPLMWVIFRFWTLMYDKDWITNSLDEEAKDFYRAWDSLEKLSIFPLYRGLSKRFFDSYYNWRKRNWLKNNQ